MKTMKLKDVGHPIPVDVEFSLSDDGQTIEFYVEWLLGEEDGGYDGTNFDIPLIDLLFLKR